MANHYKPDDVMTEIFREWIASSQDLLCKGLIKYLRMCSLNTLTEQIEMVSDTMERKLSCMLLKIIMGKGVIFL